MRGKLKAVEVKNQKKPGRYGDGGGLWLQVRRTEPKRPDGEPEYHRSWVFRYMLRGRARAMGFGPVDDVSLAEARDLAYQARKLLLQGIDPIDRRRADQAAAGGITFREVADQYLAAHEASWRNPKHRQQWRNTLDTYAVPMLGKLAVSSIDTGAIIKVLEPIWTAKPETASRLRGRIEAILDYASARGWRNGDNPARWRGHVAKLLPPTSRVQRVEHHAALPWRDMPTFWQELAGQEGVAAMALRFAILTAARTGEVIGAQWREIDRDNPDRMKAHREHRVPLTDAALGVLDTMAPFRRQDGYVFPGKPRKPLTNMAMAALLDRMGRNDITVHGFRSTFRDWCAEATNYPREIAEAALAHTNKDKTEAAYQRGDFFDRRREMMGEWAAFASRPIRKVASDA